MNADMQLVRSHDPGSFNLAVGEPFFLQEHLPFAQAIAPCGPFLYPQSRGEPELLFELERRHHGMHCVVTNGAKQAISACLAAYAEVYGALSANHPVPYWPSYPYLVRKEGLFFDGPAPDQDWKTIEIGDVQVKIDVADAAWLERFDWYLNKGGYAMAGHNYLHRVVMDAPAGMKVDHINGDRLDNRKKNLRLVTDAQNAQNQGVQQRSKSSSFKGVSLEKYTGRWNAYINVNGQHLNLGRFDEEAAAARAYDAAARVHFGLFARLNFSKAHLKLNTLVNNPDGAVCTTPVDILDCAYAHSLYGWDGAPLPPHGVAIYSAAKLFSLSGLRVGWIVTADAKLADAVSTYVERFTSGVCVTSQRHVAAVLKHLRVHDDHAFFDEARKQLLRNGEVFKRLMGDRVANYAGVPRTGMGMFAWFCVADPEPFEVALATSKVRVVTGEACGWPATPGSSWYRMSCGHHERFTEQALEALTRAWK